MDPIVIGLICGGIVLVGATLLGLGRLGQRRCKRRLLMMFDAEADVQEAIRRGELAELHDAMDIQAMKAELFNLLSHNCNGRLTVSVDGARDTGDRPCSGCVRIRRLHHQLREAEAKKGSMT